MLHKLPEHLWADATTGLRVNLRATVRARRAIDGSEPASPVPGLFGMGASSHRLEKRMKRQGQVFDGTGKLRPVEIAGPPTPDVWQESHEGAKTGFIMLDAISFGFELY